eukprot:TRINITY_DN1176_c0_g1_i1.p2 TRINITY_DN1176_c0_g1~~TRINITY_DN1176_c0_g1_i1.p2  ORF type:complete len:383 (+),score=108.50 TRINITY_DN1176_c0_g1_i1:2555-3703(+)
MVFHLLYSKKIPDGAIVVFCKDSFFAPACATCKTTCSHRMAPNAQRLMPKRLKKQPGWLSVFAYYCYVMHKLLPSSTKMTLLSANQNIRQLSVIAELQKSRVLDIVDLKKDSGANLLRHLIPFKNEVIQSMNFTALKSSHELSSEGYRSSIKSSNGSNSSVEDVDMGLPDLDIAVNRVKKWINSCKDRPQNLPKTRAKFQNSITKMCTVKKPLDPRECFNELRTEGFINTCTSCGSQFFPGRVESTTSAAVPSTSSSRHSSQWGWESYGKEVDTKQTLVTRVKSWINAQPVTSLPKSEEALLHQISNLGSETVEVQSSQVLKRLLEDKTVQVVRETQPEPAQQTSRYGSSSSFWGSSSSSSFQEESPKDKLQYNFEVLVEAL